jgi:hypothetical protein
MRRACARRIACRRTWASAARSQECRASRGEVDRQRAEVVLGRLVDAVDRRLALGEQLQVEPLEDGRVRRRRPFEHARATQLEVRVWRPERRALARRGRRARTVGAEQRRACIPRPIDEPRPRPARPASALRPECPRTRQTLRVRSRVEARNRRVPASIVHGESRRSCADQQSSPSRSESRASARERAGSGLHRLQLARRRWPQKRNARGARPRSRLER